jgi:dihydropyrimidine dehydrogenase (NAD+) subunit PreT
VYNNAHVKPIEIGRLQNYATRAVIEAGTALYDKGEPNGKRVAVIGAGPAGISCACELSTLGYEVDVFEAKERPSGLTAHGTAPYKITNEEALAEIEYLQKQLGFAIHYGTAIETETQLRELEARYDAIFLGVGLGPTAALLVPGEELDGVVGAVEFVERLRFEKHRLDVPRRVVVLGGGNTAMDAASESARMGAEQVYLAYRRGRDAMGAYDFEFDLAVGAGVRPVFHAAPLEIVGNGHAQAVRFVRTVEENGVLQAVPGSEFTIDCDLVIKATGQAKMAALLQMIPGLELDAANRIVVDPVTYQTGHAQYFAGGDAVNGGAEVVNGAYEGKRAAIAIHQAVTIAALQPIDKGLLGFQSL